MPRSSIVTSPSGARIRLCGLLSDEPSMFRDGTFRGVPIASVTDTYTELYKNDDDACFLLPLTHQTMERDIELAEHMLTLFPPTHERGLILGGHEHLPYNQTITSDTSASTCSTVQILKSGCEAAKVNLVDLVFDAADPTRLVDCQAELIDMADYAPSPVVSTLVQQHQSVLAELEHEDILHAPPLCLREQPLSSRGSRYRQTTVGSVFCDAIKHELEVDVCVINGATIKGETEYEGTNSMSYGALQKELPFPTKMVVVPMKRWELQEAVRYSRTKNPPLQLDADGKSTETDSDPVERKGYLQLDVDFDRVGYHSGYYNDDLMVAVPRNLLNGFCKIKPLMVVAERLKTLGKFPADDDFIRAIDLIVRHCCKEQWFEMVAQAPFQELDEDGKGFLNRSDVKRLLQKAIGHEPADFLVDDMIAAIDTDGNGIIDADEYSHLLAHMEREHGVAV